MEHILKVVRVLHDNHPIIFETAPIEYIIKKQYPKYQLTDIKHREILIGFEKLMNINFDKVTREELDEAGNEFKKTIESWRAILEKTANDINNLLPTLRENIKKTTGKTAHRKINSLPLFPELINLFVKSFTNGSIELEIETYPWDEIELFAVVWDNYFKDLEISSNQKFHGNDWFDLFNLVYVSPGSKYWTDEKKWIKLISDDKKTADKSLS